MSGSRRGYFRLELNLPVALSSDDPTSAVEETTTHNLSVTGALLTSGQPRVREEWVRMQLMLPRGALRLRAQVMRVRATRDRWVIGVRFQHNQAASQDAILRYLFDCQRRQIRIRQETANLEAQPEEP